MSDIFGPIIGGDDVENAVTQTLQLWLPTYLAEMERLSGRDCGTLAPPKSWSTVNAFHQYQTQQLPAAIVVSNGTDETPERRGDGTYAAWFGISVLVLVQGQNAANANELAKLYAKAVRMIALQHPSLGGFAVETEWAGDSYADVPADYLPVGFAAGVALRVRVDSVVTAYGGPSAPVEELCTAPPDLGEVETTDVTLERIAI